MERFSVNGAEFEYETVGSGEPLVLIHGVIIGDACAPLLAEPALTSRYQVTNYHRRGFLGSSRHTGPFSIAQQATDALAVIRHVAGGRAHVAGYSYGGAIALQLALDAPEAVHSLSILEVGLAVPAAVPSTAAVASRAARAAMYESGDKAGAADAFLSMAIGPSYRASIDRTLTPGWFEQAVADLDTLFQVEGPARAEWQFTEELSRPISQPVLSVVGAESGPESGVFARESHALLEQWLPQAEAFVLPGATHGLQMQNPRGMAEGLAGFLARHPMPAKSPA
jgi:pimeloyl-ACP methyl ester carboxylesterase